MAINEKIVTGKKLRRFVNGAWERMSFWHKASDCEMDNGNNLEKEIQDIKDLINNNKTANEDLRKQVLVYNKDTDYYQGYIEGQWEDAVYAGFNWDGYFIKNGNIIENSPGGGFVIDNYVAYHKMDLDDENNNNLTSLPNYKHGTRTVRGENFIEISPFYNKYGIACLRTQNMIDFKNYSKLIIKCDVQNAHSIHDQVFSDVQIFLSKGNFPGYFCMWKDDDRPGYATGYDPYWYVNETPIDLVSLCKYEGSPNIFSRSLSANSVNLIGKYYLYIYVSQRTKYNAGIRIYDLWLE